MKSLFSQLTILLVLALAIPFSGCKPKIPPQPVSSLPGCPSLVVTEDEICKERVAFRNQTRALYNNRKFAELEALADQLHTSKAQFDNGSWKILHFYDCLECSKNEPESMWQLHEQIHKDWIAAYPQSSTAYVAYANFLVDYAWLARGSGYANTVTENGWQLFGERLAAALKVLDDSASFRPQCPMWWRIRMTIALGQGWTPLEFHKLFEEAKAFEPEFWGYDAAQAHYLLPRWYGAPGEWEYVAETEANRPGSLGWEGYARVVIAQSCYHSDIFKETKASWPKARMGCELLRQKYPRSLEILNAFCNLACRAGDRALAKNLFQEINGRMDIDTWQSKDCFVQNQNWAYSNK